MPVRDQPVFEMVADLCLTWSGPPSAQIDLFESDFKKDRKLMVKLEIGRKSRFMRSTPFLYIDEWHYDHISQVLDDLKTHLLDYAARNSRSILVSLVLNISLQNEEGLERLKQVLRRSDLGYMSIECIAFDPSLASHLGQVLEAVIWVTLRSLDLHGNDLDA
jgi:hypothetical protein